jgi:hypothetical protein
MTSSEPKKNIWNIVVPIMVILLIVFIVGVSYLLWSNAVAESDSTNMRTGVILNEINMSILPNGTIYHLSEKDFEEFPAMARAIRNNSQKPTEYGGRKYYYVELSRDERIKFMNNYPTYYPGNFVGESNTYFEYNGKFYSFLPPPPVPTP